MKLKGQAQTNPGALAAIDKRIAELQADLEVLTHARLLLVGASTPLPGAPRRRMPTGSPSRKSRGQRPTIAQASQKVLEQHPRLHLREIMKQLRSTFGIETTEKNLAKTLNAWAKKKKLFRRVAPNVFTYVPSSKTVSN